MKEEIYEVILSSPKLQGQIMTATGKSYATIRRWCIIKDARLNSSPVLNLLKEHFNYETIDEFLE